MAKYIAHASYGEDGIRNQEAGDQTLKEICIRTMYFKPWNQFYHIENDAVRTQFGNNMIDIAKNDNVGYDQNGRNTLLNQAEKVDFDFSKITVKCECDCSSLVIIALLGAIYVVLGKEAYIKAKAILAAGGNCATTRTFKSRVTSKKFKAIVVITCYTSSTYTGSTDKAVFGDIYNKSGSHIVAYIDDGNKVIKEGVVYKMQTLKRGSTGNDVTIFESIMKKMGYYKGEIDIHFGKQCVEACNEFQKDYPECGTNGEPDNSWGKRCWRKALALVTP